MTRASLARRSRVIRSPGSPAPTVSDGWPRPRSRRGSSATPISGPRSASGRCRRGSPAGPGAVREAGRTRRARLGRAPSASSERSASSRGSSRERFADCAGSMLRSLARAAHDRRTRDARRCPRLFLGRRRIQPRCRGRIVPSGSGSLPGWPARALARPR